MLSAILETKIYVPTNRSGWVVRARLLQKLTSGFQAGCKFALVSAPAGFGKTTLVTHWVNELAAQPYPALVAWVSLDSSDNSLALFLTYLVKSVQRCSLDVGEVTGSFLDQVTLPSIETLLLPFINDLNHIQQPLVLVLDDYHLVREPTIHEALAFLVEHLPAQMQVVVTTRHDPLLPLARWRARGLITEVRLKDLRFSNEEISDFLRRTLGFQVSSEDVGLLENHTEGWAAGLQLAGISLQQSGFEEGESAAVDFLRQFDGKDRYVMDYLADEVLSRQPVPVQAFLLHTSVLERFNADLCQAVLAGSLDASQEEYTPASILSYLENANLFLIPLDNRREWYRFHHLFADLLQYRLKLQFGKDRLKEARQRASRWFDANGYPEEAIHYAQQAADWDLCLDLVARHGPVMVRRGEMAAALRWFSVLPEDRVRANPVLCSWYGYILTVTGKLDAGEQLLKSAYQRSSNQDDQLGLTLAFASYNACFRGEFEREIDLSRQALSFLSPGNTWERGVASISLGLGLCHTGDLLGSEQAMLAALEAGRQTDTVRTCVHALSYLGRISIMRLEFTQAEAYYQQAVQYMMNGKPYPGRDFPLFDLAMLFYERNDLEQAQSLVEQGIEANLRSGNIEMRTYGYRIAARLYQLKGDRVQAHDSLQKALQLAKEYNLSPLTLSLNAACQVRMAVAEENWIGAEQAVVRVTNSLGLFPFDFYPEVVKVHLLVSQRKKKEALEALAPALEMVRQPGWHYPLFQVSLLQAVCEPDGSKARALLYEALKMAEKERVVRPFVDLGSPLHDLLLELRPQLKPGESAFADQVLSAFDRDQKETVSRPPFPASAAFLAEPLTDRELEVLRLLADGLSNGEIAQRLYLSPNTLKAHTQNIYSKMDVHSRVQVVNKARELGLIP